MPPFILQNHLAGVPVGILGSPFPVVFFSDASCESEQSSDNGVIVEKTTLRFSTSESIAQNCPWAFIVTDVNGRSYVIGQREESAPVLSNNNTVSDDSNIQQVKVSFSARKSLIPCFL
ncbi:MAG: hypothetical protein IJS20_09695 [Bacteroidales bacterium]|nr:hypothetical protein [Bacteroidales bacterium]